MLAAKQIVSEIKAAQHIEARADDAYDRDGVVIHLLRRKLFG